MFLAPNDERLAPNDEADYLRLKQNPCIQADQSRKNSPNRPLYPARSLELLAPNDEADYLRLKQNPCIQADQSRKNRSNRPVPPCQIPRTFSTK